MKYAIFSCFEPNMRLPYVRIYFVRRFARLGGTGTFGRYTLVDALFRGYHDTGGGICAAYSTDKELFEGFAKEFQRDYAPEAYQDDGRLLFVRTKEDQ